MRLRTFTDVELREATQDALLRLADSPTASFAAFQKEYKQAFPNVMPSEFDTAWEFARRMLSEGYTPTVEGRRTVKRPAMALNEDKPRYLVMVPAGVLRTSDRFWTGASWSSEYPDAKQYASVSAAKKDAKRADDAIVVVDDELYPYEDSVHKVGELSERLADQARYTVWLGRGRGRRWEGPYTKRDAEAVARQLKARGGYGDVSIKKDYF